MSRSTASCSIERASRVACLLAGIVGVGVSSAQFGALVCYKQKWFQNVYATNDGCSTYTVCPGMVLCVRNDEDGEQHPDVIKPQVQIQCLDCTGGTLVAPSECVGGLCVPSQKWTAVPNQDCLPGCDESPIS
ncbi:MAG: hypothetical protein HRU70_01820 [Phycisphaeraceae bacterium]|nr:MAG: hypothetical protein HRU70_01820 [Phycisphaeraceae bacterium]